MVYDASAKRLLVAGGREGRGYLVAVDGGAPTPVEALRDHTERISSLAVAGRTTLLANWAAGILVYRSHDPDEPPRSIRVGSYPGSCVVSRDGSLAYVLTGCDRHPGVYDTGSALRIVPLSLGVTGIGTCVLPEAEYGEPRSLCLSRDGTTVYVACSPSDYGAATLLAIHAATTRVLARHTIREPCIWISRHGLILSAGGDPILAVDGREDSRLVLFSRDLVPRRTLPLGLGPTVLAASPDGTRGMVASRGASSLQALDLDGFSLADPFASPVDCPRLVCFDDTGHRVFVASSYVPEVACLEYSRDSRPALPAMEAVPTEERIVYRVAEPGSQTVYAMRPDGTGRRPLAYLPRTVGVFSKLSPDGRRLLYGWRKEQAWDLFALDLVTGGKQRLTDVGKSEGEACMGVVEAAFLPHGRAIVYELEYTMYERALAVVGADGGPGYPLLDNYDDHDRHPVPHPWDPDRLLFLYDSGNWSFNREIRLFDRDTEGEWIIRPRDGHTPRELLWSLDGRRIYWGRSGTELRSAVNLWSMRPDGTDAESLLQPSTSPRVYRCPMAMSPDGSRVLIDLETRGDGMKAWENYDICIADIAQRVLRPLSVGSDHECPFAWQRIVLPPSPFHVR